MTKEQRTSRIDQIVAEIKIKQDEFYRGGREVITTPEEDERKRFKQNRLSRTYIDGN